MQPYTFRQERIAHLDLTAHAHYYRPLLPTFLQAGVDLVDIVLVPDRTVWPYDEFPAHEVPGKLVVPDRTVIMEGVPRAMLTTFCSWWKIAPLMHTVNAKEELHIPKYRLMHHLFQGAGLRAVIEWMFQSCRSWPELATPPNFTVESPTCYFIEHALWTLGLDIDAVRMNFQIGRKYFNGEHVDSAHARLMYEQSSPTSLVRAWMIRNVYLTLTRQYGLSFTRWDCPAVGPFKRNLRSFVKEHRDVDEAINKMKDEAAEGAEPSVRDWISLDMTVKRLKNFPAEEDELTIVINSHGDIAGDDVDVRIEHGGRVHGDHSDVEVFIHIEVDGEAKKDFPIDVRVNVTHDSPVDYYIHVNGDQRVINLTGRCHYMRLRNVKLLN